MFPLQYFSALVEVDKMIKLTEKTDKKLENMVKCADIEQE